MKKLVSIIVALVIAGGVLFAGDFYNGDIQLQGGMSFNKSTMEDVSKDISAKEFDLGLQSWHLFRPVEIVGLGFLVGGNLGIGATDKWENVSGATNGISFTANFEIGPAVGLYLGNIVRLGGNFCFDAGFNMDMPVVYESTYSSSVTLINASYSGFSTGLQAKFFPESRCNLIFGWKLIKGFSDSYENSTTVSSSSSRSSSSGSGSFDKTIYKKYDFTQNIIYLGFGISW